MRFVYFMIMVILKAMKPYMSIYIYTPQDWYPFYIQQRMLLIPVRRNKRLFKFVGIYLFI